MPKVLISRRLPDSVLEAANAMFDVELRDKTTPMTPAEMRSGLAVYDAIMPSLGDKFSAEIFAEFGRPRCKMLANFGVGINHIDVEAARAHGVKVTNTPGAVTDATADTAMTLILMSARRAAEGERLVRSGAWEGWHPTQMLGLHVTGKTVGIVGMGRIGQAIARRCHFGFGMEVLFYNRSPKSVEFPARQVDSLTDMAGQVDILVVATPGGAETHHLIGAEVLAAMQPHAHLVNIARGDVVDEAALAEALIGGRLAGAGLDVYERSHAINPRLRELSNVVLLPHMGSATLEGRIEMGEKVLVNIKTFDDGHRPPDQVVPAML